MKTKILLIAFLIINGSGKLEIKNIKEVYKKNDIIVFDIINNYDDTVFYYITMEGECDKKWREIPILDQKHLKKTYQITMIKNNSTSTEKLFVSDFYNGWEKYHLVINYGFFINKIDQKVYSSIFFIKQ